MNNFKETPSKKKKTMGTESASTQEEMERLRQEVVRLTQELDQTSSEKIQSAQYGLVLLEEKESLESRCQVHLIHKNKNKKLHFVFYNCLIRAI